MSTLSSLVLTSSSTLTLDLVKDNFVKKMSEKSQLLWIRVLIVFFVAISAGIALFQYHSTITFIAQLMGISWGALAGAFLGPLFWGLFSKRISKAAVWTSFIMGVGLTTANMFIGFISSPITCGAIAMVLSLALVPLVSLITPAVPSKCSRPAPRVPLTANSSRKWKRAEPKRLLTATRRLKTCRKRRSADRAGARARRRCAARAR